MNKELTGKDYLLNFLQFLAHMKNITAGGPTILYYIAGICHLMGVELITDQWLPLTFSFILQH